MRLCTRTLNLSATGVEKVSWNLVVVIFFSEFICQVDLTTRASCLYEPHGCCTLPGQQQPQFSPRIEYYRALHDDEPINDATLHSLPSDLRAAYRFGDGCARRPHARRQRPRLHQARPAQPDGRSLDGTRGQPRRQRSGSDRAGGPRQFRIPCPPGHRHAERAGRGAGAGHRQ